MSRRSLRCCYPWSQPVCSVLCPRITLWAALVSDTLRTDSGPFYSVQSTWFSAQHRDVLKRNLFPCAKKERQRLDDRREGKESEGGSGEMSSNCALKGHVAPTTNERKRVEKVGRALSIEKVSLLVPTTTLFQLHILHRHPVPRNFYLYQRMVIGESTASLAHDVAADWLIYRNCVDCGPSLSSTSLMSSL